MTIEVATPIASGESLLPGVNVLLMGPPGTGKTFALGTLVDAGVELFYMGLEPGLESLLGYWTDRGLPVPEGVHWHIIEAPKAKFTDLLAQAKKVNTMSLDALAKMADPDRRKHNTFELILESLNDFKCDRTGKTFGATDEWGPGRCLAIDGMAGLARAAMGLVVGGKPVQNQSDWGIAQRQVSTLLHMITNQLKCHFVMLAHVDRETDQVLGGVKITLKSLGKALGPEVVPMFSDVILSVREGDKFYWDTGSALADVKTRNLPIRSGMPPSFKPIVDKWLSRGGVLEVEVQGAAA
jgi:hypothetical protein